MVSKLRLGCAQSHFSNAGVDGSHTHHDRLFSPQSFVSLFRTGVQVNVEERSELTDAKIRGLFLFNNALDSLNSSKEDDSVLEVFVLLEASEVDDLSLVTSTDFEVVATRVWAFIEHSLDRVGHSDLVAPVLSLLGKRLCLTDNFTRVMLEVLREAILV